MIRRLVACLERPDWRHRPHALVGFYLGSHPQGITPNSNGFLDVTIGGTIYPYSADYGIGCRAHDNNYPPLCQGTNRQSWCTQQWCYVDPQDCNVAKTVSSYFPGIDAYYSYVPCLV